MIDKTKSITFDKEAQENLPQNVKDKMKADRDNASKKKDINRINQLTIEIKKTRYNSKLMALRDDYAINLATIFGGYSWDYLPNGKFNKNK